MNTEQKLRIIASIVSWVYIYDGEFKSRKEWREGLIRMLKEILRVDTEELKK